MKKKIAYVFILLILAAVAFYGYSGFIYSMNSDNQIASLIQVGGISVVSLSIVFSLIGYNRKVKISALHSLSCLLLCAFLIFNAVTYMGWYTIPESPKVINLQGMEIEEAKKWATTNNVELVETYENSDNIDKYCIMIQDVNEGTRIVEDQKIKVVVSDGPNYDKTIIVPQMLGWKIDDVVDFIKTNHLSQANIDFSDSQEESYLVIDQSKYGQMFRRDKINFTFSINSNLLDDVQMIDLTEYTTFDAKLWLMKNGIAFDIKTEFSPTIGRDLVISQSIAAGQVVNSESKVDLMVSKGKQIEVPDLRAMSVEEVTAWVISNKLSIVFKDAYDDTITLGGIIKSNYNSGDVIEEGTTIEIITSKGQLKMESFSSLGQFKTWASTYNIKYTTKSEFNDGVNRGGIISFSHKVGDIIKNGDSITVTISKGKAVTVPNFVGMKKSDITARCRTLNIGCTFSYGSYGSKAKDTATGQSVKSGNKIESGTNVNITVSRGPAKTTVLYINSVLLGSSYNASKNSLSDYFAKNYPGVNFKFAAKAHNSLSSGLVHPSSPTNTGDKVTQGKTYTIYIVK